MVIVSRVSHRVPCSNLKLLYMCTHTSLGSSCCVEKEKKKMKGNNIKRESTDAPFLTMIRLKSSSPLTWLMLWLK